MFSKKAEIQTRFYGEVSSSSDQDQINCADRRKFEKKNRSRSGSWHQWSRQLVNQTYFFSKNENKSSSWNRLLITVLRTACSSWFLCLVRAASYVVHRKSIQGFVQGSSLVSLSCLSRVVRARLDVPLENGFQQLQEGMRGTRRVS